MSTATNNTTDNKWVVSDKITSSSGKTVVLNTAGTYVDKNIEISMGVDNASLAASGTASATISSATVGTKASGVYPLTGSANISGTATATTSDSGFATAGTTTGTGSVTGTASLSTTIQAANATVSLSATATTPTVAIDAANDNILASAATTTKPTSGYYAAVKATAPATTLTATKTISTAGYLGAEAEITASGSTTAKTGVDYYVPITAGSIGTSTFNDTTTSGTDLANYAENTSVAVPSGGSLTLSEGYYPKTFITLDQILDGKADTAGIGAADLKNGAIAYDVDGNKLTGTMPNLTTSNFTRSSTTLGGGTATFSGPTYNSSTQKFDISSSGSASKTISVSAAKEGWIAKDATAFSGSIGSGTISGSTSLSKIVGTASATASAAIKANSTSGGGLTKGAKGSSESWTDAAATSSAVTSAPTSGAYIKVDRAAYSSTVTATATPSIAISTAGYGTSTQHSISNATATTADKTVSLSAGSLYVPVKTGSASVSGGSIGGSAGSPTLNASTGKYDIAFSASGTVTGSATAGWIESVSSATVTAGATKSLNAAALTHGGTSGTAGTVSKTVTGINTSTTDTGYKVTFGSSSGTIKHNASVSEGYTPGDTIEATITVTPNKPTDVYFSTTSLTNSVSAALAGSTTGYNAPVTVSASSTAPQLKITGSGSGTTKSVLTSNGTADNKYINYYTGSYTVS